MVALIVVLVLLLSGIAGALVFRACGISLLGFSFKASWCEPRQFALNQLEVEHERTRLLRDQMHQEELALLDPEICEGIIGARSQSGTTSSLPPIPAQPESAQDVELEACAPNEERRPPKSVAVILDGSGSMAYSADLPIDVVNRHSSLLERQARIMSEIASLTTGNPLALLTHAAQISLMKAELETVDADLKRIEPELVGPAEQSRMRVAKDALHEMVMNAPADFPIALTTFNSCTRISSKVFAPGERTELLNSINRVQPGEGTPLAQSLLMTAESLARAEGNSPGDSVNIVVVSDGQDNCGMDPCAAVREISARISGLVVNVIDLSQTEELRCLADATGGSYSRSNGDASALFAEIEAAAGYTGSGQCRALE